MIEKLKDEHLDLLYDAILTLDSRKACYDFFEDLCTVPELKAMAQRLYVAQLLRKKEVYREIVAKTGASTATISRVNRTLNYGSNGYIKIFERLEKKKK